MFLARLRASLRLETRVLALVVNNRVFFAFRCFFFFFSRNAFFAFRVFIRRVFIPRFAVGGRVLETRFSKTAAERPRFYTPRFFDRVSPAFILDACSGKRVSATAFRSAFIYAAFRVSRFENN